MYIERFNVHLFVCPCMCLTPHGERSCGVDGSLHVGGDAGVFSWILEADWLNLQTTWLQQRQPGNLDRAAG